MSLISKLILPQLEKELMTLEPQVAEFLLKQLKELANEIVNWVEIKINVDLNGNGKIGE